MEHDKVFQSTCPCGHELPHEEIPKGHSMVSIHVPVRARTTFKSINSFLNLVSIHVPVRARTKATRRRLVVDLFQSTCPCGHELADVGKSTSDIKFQSTCPCGHEQFKPASTKPVFGFNPRARAGTNSLNKICITL